MHEKYFILLTIWFIAYFRPLSGAAYTSWDTHDVLFINYLYFSDCLRHGIIPLWNHLIHSGSFFPNFNNIGLYYPFHLFFIFLGWFIHPLHAFEIMIAVCALIGLIGSYKLALLLTNNTLVSVFSASAFLTSLEIQLGGQLNFLISMGALPWLIYISIIARKDEINILKYAILGLILGLFILSGYTWMNFINIAFIVFFLIIDSLRNIKSGIIYNINLVSFWALLLFTYGLVLIPGLLDMQFNYSLFLGDYVSPEPRLRSLLPLNYHLSYNSIYKALLAGIDIRSYQNYLDWKNIPTWSWGGGWALILISIMPPYKNISNQIILLIFGFLILILWVFNSSIILIYGIITLFILIKIFTTKNLFYNLYFWYFLAGFFLLYSSGSEQIFVDFIKQIPIVNANRWWNIGTFYFIICLIVISTSRVSTLNVNNFPRIISNLSFVIIIIIISYILIILKSDILQFYLILSITGLLFVFINSNIQLIKNLSIFLIIIINSASMISISNGDIPWPGNYINSDNNYWHSIKNRVKNPTIYSNKRNIGHEDYYEYNNEEWLLTKVPSTHGYNNLGNPFVWYLKNYQFSRKIISITRNVSIESPISRNDFNSDALFSKKFTDNIISNFEKPQIPPSDFHILDSVKNFYYSINYLEVSPNSVSIKVSVNNSSYLVFNNLFTPGWDAYINGVKVDNIRVNRIYQGVFLEKAGDYLVLFKFTPKFLILLISAPYILLAILLSIFVSLSIRRRGLNLKFIFHALSRLRRRYFSQHTRTENK